MFWFCCSMWPKLLVLKGFFFSVSIVNFFHFFVRWLEWARAGPDKFWNRPSSLSPAAGYTPGYLYLTLLHICLYIKLMINYIWSRTAFQTVVTVDSESSMKMVLMFNLIFGIKYKNMYFPVIFRCFVIKSNYWINIHTGIFYIIITL